MSVSVIAGGASTLSKYPALFPATAPASLVRAAGCKVLGSDGWWYTDWISALGACLLGYAHPAVTEAVQTHLSQGGPSWSLRHPLEEAVATEFLRLCPFREGGAQVRFYKSGTEATTAAVRIARAHTGRTLVLKCREHYHGWNDWSIAATPPAWGVPAHCRPWTRTFAYNDLAAVEGAFYGLDPGDWQPDYSNAEDPLVHGTLIACVILEPVQLVAPQPGFLEGIVRVAHRHGALVIFDETITALRFPAGTAARHYGIVPDLVVGGKALANGWPLAAVAGPASLMRCFELGWYPPYDDSWTGPVYCSGTWSGATDALAAALATLRVWHQEAVAERLWRTGELVVRALRHARPRSAAACRLLASSITVEGLGPRVTFRADDPADLPAGTTRAALLDALSAGLVLTNGNLTPTLAHTAVEVDDLTSVWTAALDMTRSALAAPAGPPPPLPVPFTPRRGSMP